MFPYGTTAQRSDDRLCRTLLGPGSTGTRVYWDQGLLGPGSTGSCFCGTDGLHGSDVLLILIFMSKFRLVCKILPTLAHTHTRTRTHACTHGHTDAQMRVRPHTHMQAHTHARTHARPQPHKHTHSHTLTHSLYPVHKPTAGLVLVWMFYPAAISVPAQTGCEINSSVV